MASAFNHPIVHSIVGGLELLCAIIVLGIAGSLDHDYASNPSQFNYNIFTAVWTLVFIAYFLITFLVLKAFGHPAAHLGLHFVTWVFWLAAFACCAHILNHYNFIYQIGKIRALVAFGVIEWVLFSFSLIAAVFGFLEWRRGGSSTKSTGASAGV